MTTGSRDTRCATIPLRQLMIGALVLAMALAVNSAEADVPTSQEIAPSVNNSAIHRNLQGGTILLTVYQYTDYVCGSPVSSFEIAVGGCTQVGSDMFTATLDDNTGWMLVSRCDGTLGTGCQCPYPTANLLRGPGYCNVVRCVAARCPHVSHARATVCTSSTSRKTTPIVLPSAQAVSITTYNVNAVWVAGSGGGGGSGGAQATTSQWALGVAVAAVIYLGMRQAR